MSGFALLLAQLLVILASARLIGRLVRPLGQPRVVGEMLAGIALGPSLAGRMFPAQFAQLFPPDHLRPLYLIAEAGAILYMFAVGLHVDRGVLRQKARTAVVVSNASIAAPFLLGAAMAPALYEQFAGTGSNGSRVGLLVFSLFLGTALSITAFPVLARILGERGLVSTRLGALAITCAAMGDVAAWCILVGVVAVARWEAAVSSLVPTLMILAAFLAGALTPRASGLAKTLHSRIEPAVATLMLPVFFAFTGLRTEIGLVSGIVMWSVCLLLILAAIAGKFGGTTLAARFMGTGWREAAAIGVLMNTRGLMELVVLNIGLELGVISRALFAMLVLMAVVTTFITSPLLSLIIEKGSAAVSPGTAPPANHQNTFS